MMPLTLLALSSLLLWLRGIILTHISLDLKRFSKSTYIIIGLIIIVVVLTQIIIFLVILVLEISFLHVIHFLELKSLASEPIDRTGNELLLDVFTQLVIKLKTLLNVTRGIIVIIVGWCLGRIEEVEE